MADMTNAVLKVISFHNVNNGKSASHFNGTQALVLFVFSKAV